LPLISKGLGCESGLGRQQVCSAPKNYRFGFNTQEKDDEVYGAGNLNTAEFWEYDSRIGRRWNVDPVEKEWESPYLVNSGNPIAITDPLGDDGKIGKKGSDGVFRKADGTSHSTKGPVITTKRGGNKNPNWREH
jgi:hypothetical protein